MGNFELNPFSPGSYGYIAYRDLRTAEILIQFECWNNITILIQQSIEKYLKHYINEKSPNGATPDDLRGHKLLKLLNVSGIPQSRDIRGALSEITDCYFDARYPGENYTEYGESDVQYYLETAHKIEKYMLSVFFEKVENEQKQHARPFVFGEKK